MIQQSAIQANKYSRRILQSTSRVLPLQSLTESMVSLSLALAGLAGVSLTAVQAGYNAIRGRRVSFEVKQFERACPTTARPFTRACPNTLIPAFIASCFVLSLSGIAFPCGQASTLWSVEKAPFGQKNANGLITCWTLLRSGRPRISSKQDKENSLTWCSTQGLFWRRKHTKCTG